MLGPPAVGIRPSGNMGLQLVVLVLLSPTLSALQKLRKLAWQGELSGASFLQAALSLLSLRRGRHGNTEGQAEAPLSPGAQSRPLARATTLKTKSPGPCHREQSYQAWPKPGHQTAQTLLSARAMGPKQAAHPTPAGIPHSQSSPAARSLSLELSQEERRADLAFSPQGQLGPEQQGSQL